MEIPVFGGERYGLEVYNSNTTPPIVQAYLYIRTKLGLIKTLQVNVTPTTLRAGSSAYNKFEEDCTIVHAAVYAKTGDPKRGETFANLIVDQGAGGIFRRQLCAGYLEGTKDLLLGMIESSTSGRGLIYAFEGTDPAAGADITETVPTNAMWRLISFSDVFVAAVAAFNRLPTLIIDNGSLGVFRMPATTATTSGQTSAYAWYAGLPSTEFATTLYYRIFLMDQIFLTEGWRIRTSTASMQATDNWDKPIIYVEEWINV